MDVNAMVKRACTLCSVYCKSKYLLDPHSTSKADDGEKMSDRRRVRYARDIICLLQMGLHIEQIQLD
jgi:negative regulator of replication initiation